jgi:hypothetical protein
MSIFNSATQFVVSRLHATVVSKSYAVQRPSHTTQRYDNLYLLYSRDTEKYTVRYFPYLH